MNTEQKQPSHPTLFVVLDEYNQPCYEATYASACHDHINDAINYDIEGAAKWTVVEYLPVAAPQQADKVRELENVIEKAKEALTIAHLWLYTDGRFDMYSINDAIKAIDESMKGE